MRCDGTSLGKDCSNRHEKLVWWPGLRMCYGNMAFDRKRQSLIVNIRLHRCVDLTDHFVALRVTDFDYMGCERGEPAHLILDERPRRRKPDHPDICACENPTETRLR